MAEERTRLEVIAPSVEEAIENGLQQLGMTQADVDIEILDEGKKGLLGLGGRQARVALIIKTPQEQTETPSVESGVKPEPAGTPRTEMSGDEQEAVSIARETINILLEKMGVVAEVFVKIGESDENRVQPVLIDIEGKDLSFLIGRKAETINALQFITGLIVGRELGRWIPVQIDVQQYRQRREEELRKLARIAAEQVISTGRKQILEPMPPNERRIVHLELRNNPLVKTESIGEKSRRKVTVLPDE